MAPTKHAKRTTKKPRARPIQFAQFFTAEERELLAREVYRVNAMRTPGTDERSQNDHVILRLFGTPKHAERRLAELRNEQRAIDPVEIFGRDLARRLRTAR